MKSRHSVPTIFLKKYSLTKLLENTKKYKTSVYLPQFFKWLYISQSKKCNMRKI